MYLTINNENIILGYQTMSTLQYCDRVSRSEKDLRSTIYDFKQLSLQSQLEEIQRQLQQANSQNIVNCIQNIFNLLIGVKQQICQPFNEHYLIRFVKKVSYCIQLLKCDHKNSHNKYIRDIVNLFVCKLTNTNYQMFKSIGDKISSITQWKFCKLNKQIIINCKLISLHLIQQKRPQYIQQILILVNYIIHSQIELNDSAIYTLCGLLLQMSKLNRNIDQQRTAYVIFLVKSIINKIEVLTDLSDIVTRFYAVCAFFFIKLGNFEKDIHQIQSIFKQFDFSILSLFYKHNNPISNAKINNLLKQDLFVAICQAYIKTGSYIIWKGIKSIIDIQNSINMLSNCLSFLNADKNYQLVSSAANINHLEKILEYLQEKIQENKKKYYFQKYGSWVCKQISKFPCLFIMNVHLNHPRDKSRTEKQQIFRIEFSKGILYFLVKYKQASLNNPRFGYQFYIKKEIYRWTSKQIHLYEMIDYHFQSASIKLAVEVKGQHNILINTSTFKLLQINQMEFGTVKHFFTGVKSQQRFIDPLFAIEHISEFTFIENFTYNQYIKLASHQNYLQKDNEMNKINNFISLKKKSTQKQKSLQIKKNNVLQQIQNAKLDQQQIKFQNIKIIRTKKCYKQMMEKIEGKNKLILYLLIGVERIKNSQTLQAFILLLTNLLTSTKMTKQDYDYICFIHRFSILMGKPISVNNLISSILTLKSVEYFTLRSLQITSVKSQGFFRKLKLTISEILFKERNNYSNFVQKIHIQVKSYLQRCKSFSQELAIKNAQYIFYQMSEYIWVILVQSSLESIPMPKRGKKQSQLQSPRSNQKRLSAQSQISANSVKNSMYGIQIILKQCLDRCCFQKSISQILTYFLKLIQSIISEIQLHVCEGKYVIQYIVHILEGCYQMLLDIVSKLKNSKLYKEMELLQICKILGDFYIILPNLINLTDLVPQQQNTEGIQLNNKVQVFLSYSNKKQTKYYNNSKIFLLISKYYKILILIGSILQTKTFKYLAHATNFVAINYQKFVNHESAQLTPNDKYALIQIYGNSWSYFIDIITKLHITELSKIRKTELQKVFYNLTHYFDYPIFTKYKQKISSGGQAHNHPLCMQILRFFIKYRVSLDIVEKFLDRLDVQEFEEILRQFIKQNEQMANANMSKTTRKQQQRYIQQLINVYQKPISFLYQFKESQSQRQSSISADQSFQKQISSYIWSKIYSRVKIIYQIVNSQSQKYNRAKLKKQLKLQVFNQVYEIIELVERLGSYYKQRQKNKQKPKLIFMYDDSIQKQQTNFSQQMYWLLKNFIEHLDQEIISNYVQQNNFIMFPNNRIKIFSNTLMQLSRGINKACFSTPLYRNQSSQSPSPVKNRMEINQFDIYFKTQRFNIRIYQENEKASKDKIQNSNVPVRQIVSRKILKNNMELLNEIYSKQLKQLVNLITSYYQLMNILSHQLKVQKSVDQFMLDYYVLDDYKNNSNICTIAKNSCVQALRLAINELDISQQTCDQRYPIHIQCAYSLTKTIQNIYKNKSIHINSSKQNMLATGKGKKFYSCQVHLVTKSRTYQGKISIYQKQIQFVQNTTIDLNKYLILCATIAQRRTYLQIALQRKTIKIKMDTICSCVPRLYLQRFQSIQVNLQNTSYLFVFQSKLDLSNFLDRCKSIQIKSNKDSIEMFQKSVYKWQNNRMNNFQFIMNLNYISGRSLNDTSKYYIFPWTIKSFKSKSNQKFFTNQQNFRKFDQPITQINSEKLIKQLDDYIQKITKNKTTQQILQGFYSNQTIVNRFLLRLRPLQNGIQSFHINKSKQFTNEQVFTSLKDQYINLEKSQTDLHQSLPQLYCAPQFFRSRNRMISYPKIQVCEQIRTKSPQQFIFKMRQSLESRYTTNKLNQWIDRVFGYKCELQNQNTNIYRSFINKQKQFPLLIDVLKNFGEPHKNTIGNKPFFENKLNEISLMAENREKLNSILEKQLNKLNYQQQTQKNQKRQNKQHHKRKQSLRQTQQEILTCKIDHKLVIVSNKKLQIIDTLGKVNPYEQSLQDQITNLTSLKDQLTSSTNRFLIFTLSSSGKMVSRSFSLASKGGFFSVKRSYYQLDKKTDVIVDQRFHLMRCIGKSIIISQQSTLHILRLSKSLKVKSNQKTPIMASLLPASQKQQLYLQRHMILHLHKSNITSLQTYSSLNIIISIDESNLVNVFSLEPELITRGTFYLQDLADVRERVVKIVAHEFGIMVMLTNFNHLLMYNIYGDKIINIKLQIHKINDIIYFNDTCSASVLICNKKGTIYQLDLFNIQKLSSDVQQYAHLEPLQYNTYLKINNIKNSKMIIERFGLYWKLFVITHDAVYTIVSSEDQAILKNKELHAFL